jgi:hypothetical protein
MLWGENAAGLTLTNSRLSRSDGSAVYCTNTPTAILIKIHNS